MTDDQYCEQCGRKILTHCSFCGTELEEAEQPEIWLDITIQLPVYDGIDVDELRACHNCAVKFLTEEAVQKIKQVTDIAIGKLSFFGE